MGETADVDNFYTRLIAIVVVIYGLYWMTSPYKICMRDQASQKHKYKNLEYSDFRGFCQRQTNW